MKKGSFISEVINKDDIYHIKTTNPDDGRSLHIFLKPTLLKKPQLDKILSNPSDSYVDFKEYGQILASCYGRYVSEEICHKMKKEYNFDC